MFVSTCHTGAQHIHASVRTRMHMDLDVPPRFVASMQDRLRALQQAEAEEFHEVILTEFDFAVKQNS